MDFNNIDLNDNYERSQKILENYTFETLLLEIYCNIKKENINKEVIQKHFESELKAKITEAKQIFESNIDNVIKYAKNERND